ncbi:unnamed protein product [Psylliodes chrysocephalus]|uniref:Uncharacterized protein n=1 Tax=Psylliodes chrysocephalus TaxID=3402493 RepID=A0A9P0CHC0_9CUCU|nr:unnamed protein product [Psylliodes chrysocephala]
MIFTVDETVEAENRKNGIILKMPDNNYKCDSQKPKGILAKTHIYFKEYCNSTTIHGFKYFTESRSLCERLLWLILVLFSLLACIYLIVQTYVQFQQSPVIVTFATADTPIYTIPFPAITICPQSKARSNLFNFTDVRYKIMKNQTSQVSLKARRYAKYMHLVCRPGVNLFYDRSTLTEDMFEALDELKIPQSEFMQICNYMNRRFKCNSLFFPIILDEGICYTFNILDRKDMFNENVVHFKNYHLLNKSIVGWDLDKGYQAINELYFNYPVRALMSGAENSMTIGLFQNSSNNDHFCNTDAQGFRVLLHAPYTLPRLRRQFFNVGFERSVIATVRPRAMTTSGTVQQFDSSIRKCYFSTEKKLKFFKIYSPQNCKLECLTNYTRKACGCVEYFMPRENETLICGNIHRYCVRRAEYTLNQKQLEHEVGYKENNNSSCDCKPLCSDITYDTDVSSSFFDLKDKIQGHWNRRTNNQSHYAQLKIFFEHDSFLASERNQMYGPIDFLANFGGLLGLFTGFSLLSAVELVYFLTVRMCCNFRLYRSWFGQEQDSVA